jgi:hypothetical protein
LFASLHLNSPCLAKISANLFPPRNQMDLAQYY